MAAAAAGTPPTAPALPRVFLNTTYPTQTGRTLHVPATGSIQAAIDSARFGDVITLQAGVTYRQTVYLRPKPAGTGWIVIRTTTPDASLPAGRRVGPADAAKLARIAPAYGPVIRTGPGSHHYRLVGIEAVLDSSLAHAGQVLSLGEGGPQQDAVDEIPHDLVLDRMWIHAWPHQVVLRCVGLNSASTALIDSYVSECHHDMSDSQAAGGFNGPGPFKIVNNYLEGAGEVVMFGGGDPTIPNLVPSDIEIRYNTITRPVSWKDKWMVKNLFEVKNGQRILVEGNLMENNWVDGQAGTAVLLKSTNQSGRCTWCVTRDVTMRYNHIRRTPTGFNIAAKPESNPAILASHIQIAHNIIELDDPDPIFGGGGTRSFQLTGALTDIDISHNTIIDTPSDLLFIESSAGTTMARIAFRNNIGALGPWGIHGSSVVSGQATLDKYAPGAIVTGNVMAGITGGKAYPAGNFFPLDLLAVGFESLVGRGFRLSALSPYRGKAPNGADPGVDVTALETALRGLPAPIPAPLPVPTTEGAIVNAAGGCLATSGANPTVATWVTIITCAAGSPRQVWTLPATGTTGKLRLGTLCADASMGKVGSVLFVGLCVDGRASQEWTLTAAGELRATTGACLAAVTLSWGKRAELEACAGKPTQRWTR